MAHVIGCDVGSQSLKGVLIDGDGDIIAEASAPYDLSFPHPGWAEQNPDDWLRALSVIIATLLRRGGVAASGVGVLGLAIQVGGVVPVDAQRRHLLPAIIWLDRRGACHVPA